MRVSGEQGVGEGVLCVCGGEVAEVHGFGWLLLTVWYLVWTFTASSGNLEGGWLLACAGSWLEVL